jgi:hypothetical protein
MPVSGTKHYNTFVKGLITEAGPLTYPENASLDEENCVLNRDGSRQRRLGMDFEDSYVLRNATIEADDAVGVFRWYNVGNDSDVQFAVVQTGQILSIYDLTQTSVSGTLIDTVDLSAYITGKTLIDAVSGMGFLFIVEGTAEPMFLEYDATTGQVSRQEIDILIRDFFGVTDALGTEGHPLTLSDAHEYNLLNQGWDATKITAYFTAHGEYPANNEQWFVGKDSLDDFDPALLVKQDFGDTYAPRGRFKISAWNRSTDRDAYSGGTTDVDIEEGRPQCVGFAFDRVFYSGVESSIRVSTGLSPNLTGWVLFSRTLRNTRDFGRCYQEADPTSEIDSELVDTDGGYINIPASGRIHKLLPKGDSILVFAELGIWQIYGQDGAFAATAFVVEKVTDLGVLSATSVVDSEQNVLFWNRGGIYVLEPEKVINKYSTTNLSENSIQSFYNEIPLAAKKNAMGSYDPVNRRITWLYNDSEDYDGVNYRNQYTKELVLDTVLGAFSKNTISEALSPSPYIAGYVETPDFLRRQEGVRSRFDSVTKYLIVQYLDVATNSAAVTFGYYRNADFLDWASASGGGVNFDSYLITGYEILEDATKQKQAPYIYVHLKQTEAEFVDDGAGGLEFDNPSSCIVQARWDFSTDGSYGKWSTPFQAYRLKRPYIPELGTFTYGQEMITTKTLLRGRGRGLSLKFISEEGHDFYLFGWSLYFTGDGNA